MAPYYRLVGSGIVRPDLGAARISAITPSQGFRPEREDSHDADIFQITLDPGAVVTYVVELRSTAMPQLQLWQPDAYKDKVNCFTLYRGMVLGIAGLLALFLTVFSWSRERLMFPAAAGLAWAVLAYLSIDFGFWSQVFRRARGRATGLSRRRPRWYSRRRCSIFLYTYLHLNRWHVRYRHVAGLWLLGLMAVTGLAVDSTPRSRPASRGCRSPRSASSGSC